MLQLQRHLLAQWQQHHGVPVMECQLPRRRRRLTPSKPASVRRRGQLQPRLVLAVQLVQGRAGQGRQVGILHICAPKLRVGCQGTALQAKQSPMVRDELPDERGRAVQSDVSASWRRISVRSIFSQQHQSKCYSLSNKTCTVK